MVDPEPRLLGFRAKVVEWLGAEIVAEAATCAEAPLLVDVHHPDLVVVPSRDSLACLHLADHVRESEAKTQVVVVSDCAADTVTHRRMLASGALVVLTPPPPRNGAGAMRLTRREWEICSLLASGLSNRAIGQQLWVTERTIKFHISNIYKKLGVTSRHDAVIALEQLPGLAK